MGAFWRAALQARFAPGVERRDRGATGSGSIA